MGYSRLSRNRYSPICRDLRFIYFQGKRITGDYVAEDVISESHARDALLFISKRKAVSAAQMSLELGLSPQDSVSLTRHLVHKGYISGSPENHDEARLTEFYSLTAKGVRATRTLKKDTVWLV